MSHVKQEHPGDFKNAIECKGLGEYFSTSESAELSIFSYKKKVKQIFCCLYLVINSFQLFRVVENEIFVCNMTCNLFSRSSIANYMNLMNRKVEDKIRHLFPSKVALVFNG